MVEEAEAASAVLEMVENLACWRTFAELLMPCGVFTTKPSVKGAADRTARRAEVVFILLGSVAVSFCFFFFVVHSAFALLLLFAAAGLFVVRVDSPHSFTVCTTSVSNDGHPCCVPARLSPRRERRRRPIGRPRSIKVDVQLPTP